MANHALGCAIYFDTDLSADTTALFALWDALAPAASAEVTQWITAERTQQVGKPVAFDASALRQRIEHGEAASVAIETAPKTADEERVLVLAQTTPAARLRDAVPPRHWKYNLVVALGARPLERIGRQTAVDAVVACADHIGVKAGVMHWTATTSFASGLAMGAAGGGLSASEEARITDSLYWRSHWGRIVRGPAWGTFLGSAHVERLGGLDKLRPSCTRIVPLRSGGAFLQLTSVDEPILDGEDDDRIARLRGALGDLAPDPA